MKKIPSGTYDFYVCSTYPTLSLKSSLIMDQKVLSRSEARPFHSSWPHGFLSFKSLAGYL
jgi:hypothetical protein